MTHLQHGAADCSLANADGPKTPTWSMHTTRHNHFWIRSYLPCGIDEDWRAWSAESGQSAISTSIDHSMMNRWKRITMTRLFESYTSWWTKRGRLAMCPSTTLNEEIDVVRRWQQHGRMELRRLVRAAESLKPMMSRLIAWAWYRSHCQI